MGMIFVARRLTEDQLRRLTADPALTVDLLYDEDGRESELDLDQAWHGIHFLQAVLVAVK